MDEVINVMFVEESSGCEGSWNFFLTKKLKLYFGSQPLKKNPHTGDKAYLKRCR